MKKFLLLLVTMLGLAFAPITFAAPGGKYAGCTTIQGGTLYNSYGDMIYAQRDVWGYSYQGRNFNGAYCGAYHDAPWCQLYVGTELEMKWDEMWLDNKDCNDDGILDRHRGFSSYRGSGAWLTNHMRGTNSDGTKWVYFVKIKAAPIDASIVDGVWVDNSSGEGIGIPIWGEFMILLETENVSGPGAKENGRGRLYNGGFGRF